MSEAIFERRFVQDVRILPYMLGDLLSTTSSFLWKQLFCDTVHGLEDYFV
jgi:hypothetical protein